MSVLPVPMGARFFHEVARILIETKETLLTNSYVSQILFQLQKPIKRLLYITYKGAGVPSAGDTTVMTIFLFFSHTFFKVDGDTSLFAFVVYFE